MNPFENPWTAEKNSSPRSICPERDNPLRGLHAIGWNWLDRRMFPRDSLHNPLAYYLLPRLRAGLGTGAAIMPWVILTTVEVIILLFAWRSGELALFLVLVAFEITFLPLAAAFWSQRVLFNFLNQFLARVPHEELRVTQLSPRDVFHALVSRPMMVNAIGLRLNAVLFAGAATAYLVLESTRIVMPGLAIIGILGFSYARYFALLVFSEMGMASGAFAFFRERNRAEAASSMARIVMRPWGYLMVLLPMGFLFLSVTNALTGNYFDLLLMAYLFFAFTVLVPVFMTVKTQKVFAEAKDAGKWWWYVEG